MTMTPAGMLCRCICCGDPFPEDEAKSDHQLGGPICPSCHIRLRGAAAWLKEVMGPCRPFTAEDVGTTPHNINRFKDYK